MLRLACVALVLLASSAHADERAVRAQDVWSGFGVNTHLDGCCNGNGGHDYNDTDGVIAALTYIGNVRLVRDFWSSDKASERAALVAQRTGARFVTAISNTKADPGFAGDLVRMRAFQATCHCVFAYEGPNESDSSYSVSLGGPFLKQAAAFIPRLHDAAVTDGVKSIQMSFEKIYPDPGDYNCCGLIDHADFANAHTYPQGAPSTLGMYGGALDWSHRAALIPTPGRPVAHTEFGWTVPASSHYGSVSPEVQAEYVLDFIFDAWRHGDPIYIYYGLYDDMSGTWGLFDAANRPRSAARALHALSALLADPGKDARSFTPATLAVSFGRLPSGPTHFAGGQYLVMQKSDDSFWIELQNEAVRNDWRHDNADVPVPTSTVAVEFASPVRSVVEFDPIASGETPVHRWTGVSNVSIPLPAHPILLQVAR
jgi:hypothetical protein